MGFYYLQSRYYNPALGRFLNADALISTGQGVLGNNMFAYCLNNPVGFCDPTGERVEIWPILFGDYNFGYIHNAVRDHIVTSGLFKGELYLPGIGRADIFDPETMEIWEIKHGGSSSQMQLQRRDDALEQAVRYINGAKNKLKWTLQLGHAGAFRGCFIINCENISYLITYETPEPGVILYFVQQMKSYESAASLVYVRREYKNTVVAALSLGCVGALVYIMYTTEYPSAQSVKCTG